MNNTLLLGLGLLLSLTTCKKNDPEASLPDATQVGANTGGCLINGQVFVAQQYGGGVLSSPVPAMQGGFAFNNQFCLFINGQLNGKSIELLLFLNGEQPTSYLLNQNTLYYPQGSPRYVLNHGTYRVVHSSSREVYGTNSRHTGQVTLTKADVQGGLSAGTFAFTAVSNQDSTKTVTITNGRFDRKL